MPPTQQSPSSCIACRRSWLLGWIYSFLGHCGDHPHRFLTLISDLLKFSIDELQIFLIGLMLAEESIPQLLLVCLPLAHSLGTLFLKATRSTFQFPMLVEGFLQALEDVSSHCRSCEGGSRSTTQAMTFRSYQEVQAIEDAGKDMEQTSAIVHLSMQTMSQTYIPSCHLAAILVLFLSISAGLACP